MAGKYGPNENSWMTCERFITGAVSCVTQVLHVRLWSVCSLAL